MFWQTDIQQPTPDAVPQTTAIAQILMMLWIFGAIHALQKTIPQAFCATSGPLVVLNSSRNDRQICVFSDKKICHSVYPNLRAA